MPAPNVLPKSQRIADMLIREIGTGRLAEGERLPPERTMAAELGVSVGTLRKALAVLEGKDLLERVQGSGNYVRNRPDASAVYAFFRLELNSGGGRPTAEVLSVERLEKPAGAPDFGPSPDAHRIRRLRYLSGVPAALEEIWLDAARAERIRANDLSDSLYLFYRERLNFWIARAEDRVGVDRLPDWAPPRLGILPGVTVGFVERVAQDQEGRRVEYSRTWFDADRVRYVARLR